MELLRKFLIFVKLQGFLDKQSKLLNKTKKNATTALIGWLIENPTNIVICSFTINSVAKLTWLGIFLL